MRTFGRPSLGDLWEHAVMPIVQPAVLFNATEMAYCLPRLLAGNLHLDMETKAQAEYLICGRDADSTWPPRRQPRLVAAWGINQNASSRGTVSLAPSGGVVGNYTFFEGQPGRAEKTIQDIFSALRARYGA